MSVLVKAAESIFKDPLNTSPSKYQFSFSRAPRFPGSKPKMTEEEIKKVKEKEEKAEKKFKQLEDKVKYKKQDYYLLPTTKSLRCANFGFHPPVDNRSKKLTKSVSTVVDPKKLKKIEKKDLINQFAEYDYEKKYFHGVKYSIPSYGKDAEEKKKEKELKRQKRKEKERRKREENYRYKNSIRLKKEKKNDDDFDKDSEVSPGPGEYDILKKVNEDFGYNSPKIIMRQPYEVKTEILKKIKSIIRQNSEKRTERKLKLKIKDGNSKTKDDKFKIGDDKPIVTDINVQIRNTGKYYLSQIPNVNSVRMQKTEKEKEYEKLLASNDKNDKKRLKLLENIKMPGPGDYSAYDKCEINNNKYTQFPKTLMGNMVESKYRSHGGITFGTSSEIKDSRINYPGPGSYRMPSDFGIYVKKGYEKKYPEQNVYPEEKHKTKDRPLRTGTKKSKEKKEGNKNKKKGDNKDDKNEPEIINEDKKEDGKENNEDNKKENNEDNEKENKEGNADNEDNEVNKENNEDKESECKMLRDILSYKDI